MNELTPLESEALRLLLDGKVEWLATLRQQASRARVISRKLTGAGFFTRFSVPPDAPKVANKASFRIGDVSADINDLKYGAGFLLLVKDCLIDSLEGYSYEEPWPTTIHTFRVFYTSNGERDESALLNLY